MTGKLVLEKPIHKVGELVTDVASPYPRNTIFKITQQEESKGWYYYTLKPLSFLEKLKLRFFKREIKKAFSSFPNKKSGDENGKTSNSD